MKKKGLIGGFVVANTVSIAEIVSLIRSFSDLSNVNWKNIIVISAIILLQIGIGLFLGNEVDKKVTKRLVINELKTRDFAVEVFNSLAAMATRNNGTLTLYLITIHNFEDVTSQLLEEDVVRIQGIIERTISNTIRKGDIFAKWDEYRYLIIAADHGYERSTMIERIQTKVDDAIIGETLKVPIIFGAAIYPIDGNNLDALIEIAHNRLYESRSLD